MQHTILRLGLVVMGFVHAIGLYDNAIDKNYDLGLTDVYYENFLGPLTVIVGLYAAWMFFKSYGKAFWGSIFVLIALWWIPINPFHYLGRVEIYDPISVWTVLNFSVAVIAFYLAWNIKNYRA